MFRSRRSAFLCLVLLTAMPPVMPAAEPAIERAIASGRNDVVYLAPATEPYEALPLGNGRLGVMVRNVGGLAYVFNHGSFFAGSNAENCLASSGEFDLRLPREWTAGFVEQRLVLYDGTIVTRYRNGTDTLAVTSWVAEGLDALVVHLECSVPLPDLPVRLWVWDRLARDFVNISLNEPGALKAEAAVLPDAIALSTLGMLRATALVAAPLAGEVRDVQAVGRDASLVVPGGSKALTLVVAGPVVRGEPPTREQAVRSAQDVIAKARQAGLDGLRQARDAYWHSFWSRSGVLMHSEDGLADYAENLYHLFLYWMAGCSRGPDVPKFNGANYLFCNDWRSWGAWYWYQNTREMYWAVLPANHAELFAPLPELYWRTLPASRKWAAELYGAPGACVQETLSPQTGQGCKSNNPGTALYHTTGTEMAFQMYSYYLYTRDEEFLRDRAYPLLKETLAFHCFFLTREADGKYHLGVSSARETYRVIKDCVTDLAALRGALPCAIAASRILGVDPELRRQWEEILANLAPFVLDPVTDTLAAGTFFKQFPAMPYRNAAKVFLPDQWSDSPEKVCNSENVWCEPVYPWGVTGLASPPADLDRARRTFLGRRFRHWTYGNAWDASAIWAARLGLADEIVRSMRQFLQTAQTFPNGMAGTPGSVPDEWGKQIGDSPGFDGSGVFATAVAEMQLQSYGGAIRVYPAWPKGWESEFTLAAEGGFVVSAATGRDGQVPAIVIRSRLGGECRVANPWPGAAVLVANGKEQALAHQQTFVFPTVTEGVYTLRPAAPVAALAPIPVAQNRGPKWPEHLSAADSADDYLKRNTGFGFIGLTRDGDHATKRKIRRALLIRSRQPAVTAPLFRDARPLCRVAPVAAAPVIDGKLDDACWQTQESIGPLFILDKPTAAARQTEARLAYDVQNLYIALVCRETNLDEVTANPVSDEVTGSIFQEDCVELYLQPPGDGYWHLVLNAAGGKYDSWGTPGKQDVSRNLRLRCAASRQKDAWCLEVAIPFSELGGTPGPGWRFNLGRNQTPAKELSTWAPLSKHAFHLPNEFGRLEFGSAPLP